LTDSKEKPVAKRKSTDKTSQKDVKNRVDKDDMTGAADVSDTQDSETPSDKETAVESVEAVDAYAPTDEDTVSADGDDSVELQEPSDDPALETGETTGADTVETIDGADAAADDVTSDVKGTDTENTVEDHLSEEEAEQLIVDAETVEGHDADPEPVTPSDPVSVAPQVIRETTVERKGGFFPMLIGGAVAAAIGYGAAAYVSQDLWPFEVAQDTGFEDDVREALTNQDGSLSDLGDRVAALENAETPVVDLTPLEEQISAVQQNTADMDGRLDELAARIDTLERQPLDQAVSPEAIEAYERALEELQAEVDAQRSEVAQMAQEAVSAEENAEEQAQLAASRAALAEITSALESGESFSDAVSVLSSNGVSVPEALVANAESGVATLGSLIESYPSAARSALSAARSVETEGAEGPGRIATFFANQLGARSVAPREGDDADAILSRVEAAVRAGDLDTALSELSSLPEAAQNAMSEWRIQAQTRLEAKTAADGLVQQLIQE
jgi:hypothetical protein